LAGAASRCEALVPKPCECGISPLGWEGGLSALALFVDDVDVRFLAAATSGGLAAGGVELLPTEHCAEFLRRLPLAGVPHGNEELGAGRSAAVELALALQLAPVTPRPSRTLAIVAADFAYLAHVLKHLRGAGIVAHRASLGLHGTQCGGAE
jgi:hypothetical protein